MKRALLIAAALMGLAACKPTVNGPSWAGLGDAKVGKTVIIKAQCGACHDIPGVDGAAGQVGPSLEGFADRTVAAGVLPNTPENLVHWLRYAQQVKPGDAMPNTGLSDRQARDAAAYLYTLK